MSSRLVELLAAAGTQPAGGFDRICDELSRDALWAEVEALDAFRRQSSNLYQRVRALIFLHALYRYRLTDADSTAPAGAMPPEGQALLRSRDFSAAIDVFRAASASPATKSALGAAYRSLAFQTLADQVRSSVRAVEGNRWMFDIQAPDQQPLRARAELGQRALTERTPVRMDLSHSAWSDIFFLAMDAPESARVLNVSIDLAVKGHGPPRPPVEATVRWIDQPLLRLRSVDLGADADVREISELFDFSRDYLGLLKSAVIAAGVVPPGSEGRKHSVAEWLAPIAGEGRGLELTTSVHGIPKGSRLAVSTTLLASSITALMRASGQTEALEGGLTEPERRRVCARALLGEWLGGSGGGWQDSGGVWPGLKLIEGAVAGPRDPEHGTSRGALLPKHTQLSGDALEDGVLARLVDSLVLVHGGMAQDVGPVLEMVTERYLLGSRDERDARSEARLLFDAMLGALRTGDIPAIGRATHANFFGPVRTIIPQASNPFTEGLVRAVEAEFGADFWGFWMLGGMSGGGMGLLFAPAARARGEERVQALMGELKSQLEHALAFAMDPVVYHFAINQSGSVGVLEPSARAQCIPGTPDAPGDDLDTLLALRGFDPERHGRLRQALVRGEISASANRLPRGTRVEDVRADDVVATASARTRRLGAAEIERGSLAIVTLAGGSGSRWSGGAGTVKALAPIARFDGEFRSFLDVHRAKSARRGLEHMVTASYVTEPALQEALRGTGVRISAGRTIGLRLVPTERDLRFTWRAETQQRLDECAQRVREGLEKAWIAWAKGAGEASDYRDNRAQQCVHPLGHAWELPNTLLSGALADLLEERPEVRTLFLHNIDTLGAGADPGLLGAHLESESTFSFEVVPRSVEDAGGGLARIDGQLRLVEGMALPRDDDELQLSYYNTMSTWIDIDRWLALLDLRRSDLRNAARLAEAVAAHLETLPHYLAIRNVRKVWGRGQVDVFPVAQIEQLWSDVTTLPGAAVQYLAVPRRRGAQLKEPAQLDGWLRDGSAEYVAEQCGFAGRRELP